jgi:hypothetical protein
MAVLDVGVGRSGVVRRCRRGLERSIGRGRVVRLGCMTVVVGSLGVEVAGCCCRS